METAVAVQDEQTLRQAIAPVVSQANTLTVISAGEYEFAASFLKNVKTAQKRVVDFFGPMKRATHEAWKKTVAGETTFLGPLESAERTVKQKMLTWSQAEERERALKQARLQAQADEFVRRERERLEKEAARLKTPELKQQRLEQAAAVITPVVQVVTETPKVVGIGTRKIWKASVMDAEKVPKEFLMVDEAKLDRYAKAMKELASVEGVYFYQEEIMSAGSR